MKKIIICSVLFLFITVSSVLNAVASNFFDNEETARLLIVSSLSVGMITGHNGLVGKSIYFLADGNNYKAGSPDRIFRDKAAWYNLVNAHRMLDSAYSEMISDKRSVYKELQGLDKMITDVGKNSFGWDLKKSHVMYKDTRELIEAMIKGLNTGCFGAPSSK